jgi:hypothetical protein
MFEDLFCFIVGYAVAKRKEIKAWWIARKASKS